MSADERTGWRDIELSRRHRRWGPGCPCVNLDGLMFAVEYDFGEPKALVDYKHHLAGKNERPELTNHSMEALWKLATHYRPGSLPFMVAHYWRRNWSFRVWPLNEPAEAIYRQPYQDLSEAEYVRSLYYIRGKPYDPAVLSDLNITKPPVEQYGRTSDGVVVASTA